MKYSRLQQAFIAMGTHIPYGITQCYLPPNRSDNPTFTTAN